MNPVAEVLLLIGGFVAVLAGVGVLRFRTPSARIHAAGKASPVAFLITALGAAIELGAAGSLYLAIASVAMVLTLPVGVHLLFKAVHQTEPRDHLIVDDLGDSHQR